jgi:hypothetical protein
LNTFPTPDNPNNRAQDPNRDNQAPLAPSSSVADFIRATNLGDLAALLATFADDALVNDQLRDYWGISAIAAWARRDIIGEQITLEVVNTVQHYGHWIITAHIEGIFDRRGLPDPLVLAFYFSSAGNKIVQLIILRNLAGL